MSVVLPRGPHAQALQTLSQSPTPNISSPIHSRPSTPSSTSRLRSRPCTPPPPLAPSSQLNGMQPISAPPTPVTTTHLMPTAMGRCRSSEAALSSPLHNEITDVESSRDGRRREVKATSLLFQHVPSAEDIKALEERARTKGSWEHLEDTQISPDSEPAVEDDMRMDVDEVEDVQSAFTDFRVWGMPKWGWEKKEASPGVRTVGIHQLSDLIEQHRHTDTPSHVLFPWLHGISDDGKKGSDMGAFFGWGPPFEPPAYRGLTVMLAPPNPLDVTLQSFEADRPSSERADSDQTTRPPSSISDFREPRERSETMSTSSESNVSSNATTEGTSPSVADWQPPQVGAVDKLEESPPTQDVQMHPCEAKRTSMPLSETTVVSLPGESSEPRCLPTSSDSDSSSEEEEEPRPSAIMLNALHVQDVFDVPKSGSTLPARFRLARLPQQINLRNLNIQQIKYTSISDVVVYGKHGATAGLFQTAERIAEAQERLYESRMSDYYARHPKGKGEGLDQPIRYGVWVLIEPFHEVQSICPHLINLDSDGNFTLNSHHTDLFEREAVESRVMTRGSEVVEGFWVGNDCDVPGGADDGASHQVDFDLCVRASECCDMPTNGAMSATMRRLYDADKRKQASPEIDSAWTPSPATLALRNLLSPSVSPKPIQDVGSKRVASPTPQDDGRQRRPRRASAGESCPSIDCAGSCRTLTGQLRNLTTMTDRVVEFVYFLRKLVEGREKSGRKRKILLHCQDGYTESSIVALSYIMSSLSLSLPEAFLHLQVRANRSFFVYPSDKPLLRKVDARLAADRRAKAIKLVTSATATPSPTRWKSWNLGFGKHDTAETQDEKRVLDVARNLLEEEENGGSHIAHEARVWFDDRRFDGFPSRILPFLYLGNLEHAGNVGMLYALGITHVVSVGESLINCPPEHDPIYGHVGRNTLSHAAHSGAIQVLDLLDIRDDGNDPLRPLIAKACAWIDAARQSGGCVLVHCRVGVSRSASIVIAYMMQYHHMGLIDAYLLTRARRLNVLIQPNLRFFHEMFGWEVELARREANQVKRNQGETGIHGGVGSQRRIVYSWPSFCRDIHCLNRRFLCN